MRNLILCVFAVAFLSSTTNAQYTAAVVEYAPLNETTPNATVETNLKEYIHYIETAKRSEAQIIVFPEYGLTGLVEDPTNYAIEIPNAGSGTAFTDYWLQILSNAAREHSLYIVVNLLEKATNENNDTIYYNANIVFDKNGAIIAKYRKINLFFEPKLTPGTEAVTFTTDFGITFGILTCFDILFYHPSRSILNSTVTDIIFPTAWTSVLPFYHSLTVQSGYAQGNRVSLLAADLNNPSQGLGGSGIFAHDGTVLQYYISGQSSSRVMISNVLARATLRDEEIPISTFGFDILGNNTPASDLGNFITTRDFPSSRYTFRQLSFANGDVQQTLCDGAFCCNFTIAISELNATEVYQILVYNGPAVLGDTERNVKICSLVSCETSDPSTCGSRNVSLSTKFNNISISGIFENHFDHFYQPATLTTDLLPIFNTSFSSESSNETITITFRTTRITEKVIAFGIFGRGAASTFGSSIIFLVVLAAVNYFL